MAFHERVRIFQDILTEDRERHTGNASMFQMWNGMSTRIQVHRDRLASDAFEQLKGLKAHDLKNRMQIEFISGEDRREAGIDGGGLYKEFIDELIKEVFDPAYGLFRGTSSQLLVPNPDSAYYHEEHLEIFHFIGKMLGKAMFVYVYVIFRGLYLYTIAIITIILIETSKIYRTSLQVRLHLGRKSVLYCHAERDFRASQQV